MLLPLYYNIHKFSFLSYKIRKSHGTYFNFSLSSSVMEEEPLTEAFTTSHDAPRMNQKHVYNTEHISRIRIMSFSLILALLQRRPAGIPGQSPRTSQTQGSHICVISCFQDGSFARLLFHRYIVCSVRNGFVMFISVMACCDFILHS